MTTQTIYEAKDFLFSSKEEAEMFENSFDLDAGAESDFSCMFVRPRQQVIRVSLSILSDLDEIFDGEYLHEETTVFLLANESDEFGTYQKLYRVNYYVDDGVMDVYKKSCIHASYRANKDSAFVKVDSEASQYWIRVVNGAALKRDVLTKEDMKTALMQLFDKRVYR